MARESKRRREERRLGSPKSLADNLIHRGWMAPGGNDQRQGLMFEREHYASIIPDSVFVSCDNVAEYVYSLRKGKEIDWLKDFPNCRPPFEHIFIECENPAANDSNDIWPHQWGGLVWSSSLSGDALWVNEDEPQEPRDTQETQQISVSFFASGYNRDAIPIGPLGIAFIEIDRTGTVLEHPQVQLAKPVEATSTLGILEVLSSHLYVIMTSLAFMNCKNVALQPHDPPADINRQRRRAGLRPFVRYHTINIEPMKAVLRTEGDIEHNGLKRALHICRGHFATYTDRMFGRKLDKPVTVFREAHVRGSAKEGLVISDYKVNPPRPAGGPR